MPPANNHKNFRNSTFANSHESFETAYRSYDILGEDPRVSGFYPPITPCIHTRSTLPPIPITPAHRLKKQPHSHASPTEIPSSAITRIFNMMRRYNPFATSEDTHTPPISTSSEPDQPPSPRSSYLPSLPSVPALPSVRKYFTLAGPSARRPSTTSTDDDDAVPSPALPELSGMIEQSLGPVGQPNDADSKRLAHDKLLAGFHASVPERNRLLRQFLRARQHNAQEALRMINSTLCWRKQVGIESYLEHPARNMVSPDACFPMHILSTPQNCKQPVVFGLIRLLDKKKAERGAFQNALLSFLESIYFAETYVLDEMIIILDFRDWSIRKNAPYRLVKEGIQTLQNYYPERLGRVFLVNYPTSIRAAYTAVSPIIDPGAKEKIVWVPDADPSVTLNKYVAAKSIPAFLGGELEADFPPSWPDIPAEYEAAKSSQHGLFHYH